MSWYQRLRSDERGTTMMELIVSMTLMVVFGGIFSSAIVLMNSSANKAESVTVSTAQLNTAFQRLDKLVRYAAVITTPSKSTTSGDWYVELRTTNTGSEQCTQLQLDITTGALRSRSWSVSTQSVAGTASAWVPLATGFTNGSVAAGSADQPFTVTAVSTNTSYQSLTINLVAKAGNSTPTTARSSLTLSALNTDTTANPATVCQQKGQP